MTKSAKKMTIWVIFMKLAMFRASQTPPQPKTMRQTKYLDPRASHEKNIFFAKNIFSQKFSLFSRPQNPKNRDLPDLDPWFWIILGMRTSPERPDLELFDFEVSKKVKKSAKKHFLKKNFFFS